MGRLVVSFGYTKTCFDVALPFASSEIQNYDNHQRETKVAERYECNAIDQSIECACSVVVNEFV
jgi:hypothetical protein